MSKRGDLIVLRNEWGLTRRELADLLDFAEPEQKLYRMEYGKALVSPRAMAQIDEVVAWSQACVAAIVAAAPAVLVVVADNDVLWDERRCPAFVRRFAPRRELRYSANWWVAVCRHAADELRRAGRKVEFVCPDEVPS